MQLKIFNFFFSLSLLYNKINLINLKANFACPTKTVLLAVVGKLIFLISDLIDLSVFLNLHKKKTKNYYRHNFGDERKFLRVLI